MKNTCPFYYMVFQVLKVLLIKICKMQPLDLLFFVVFISFYISRYHFSQIFRSSFNIIWKKDFRHKFSFFNGFTQTPHPINSSNRLGVTKFFCQYCLSTCGLKLRCLLYMILSGFIITVHVTWISMINFCNCFAIAILNSCTNFRLTCSLNTIFKLPCISA